MRKLVSIAAMLAFLAAPSLPASGDAARKVKLAGWITDEWCGAKNANADGAGCVKACAKQGAQLVLISEGKIYKLSDQKGALEHVGHKVLVTGTIEGKDRITIIAIEKLNEKV